MLDRLFEEFVKKHKYGELYNFIVAGTEIKNIKEIIQFSRKSLSRSVIEKMEILNNDWEDTLANFKSFIEDKKSEQTPDEGVGESFVDALRAQKKQQKHTMIVGSGMMDQMEKANQYDIPEFVNGALEEIDEEEAKKKAIVNKQPKAVHERHQEHGWSDSYVKYTWNTDTGTTTNG